MAPALKSQKGISIIPLKFPISSFLFISVDSDLYCLSIERTA